MKRYYYSQPVSLLSASPSANLKVTLSSLPEPGAGHDGLIIFRKTGAAGWYFIGILPSGVTSFDDYGNEPNYDFPYPDESYPKCGAQGASAAASGTGPLTGEYQYMVCMWRDQPVKWTEDAADDTEYTHVDGIEEQELGQSGLVLGGGYMLGGTIKTTHTEAELLETTVAGSPTSATSLDGASTTYTEEDKLT